MEGPNIFDKFSPKEWEKFCERMLRHKYGQRYFFPVPDNDSGDLGIEFFTSCGTIFQCYFPDPSVGINEWKLRIKNKIRDDLKKLKDNEKDILQILDGVEIDQWVLLTPRDLSRKILPYCNTKKRELLKEPPSFLNPDKFIVKLETPDTYPDSKIYALSNSPQLIHIDLPRVTQGDKEAWVDANSDTEFLGNIDRKSINIMAEKAPQFKERVIQKYIQMENFLQELRENYPDQHVQLEDTAWALLDRLQDLAVTETPDADFIQRVLQENRKAFEQYTKLFSERNLSAMSFGYLSKWIAECYMDFQ